MKPKASVLVVITATALVAGGWWWLTPPLEIDPAVEDVAVATPVSVQWSKTPQRLTLFTDYRGGYNDRYESYCVIERTPGLTVSEQVEAYFGPGFAYYDLQASTSQIVFELTSYIDQTSQVYTLASSSQGTLQHSTSLAGSTTEATWFTPTGEVVSQLPPEHPAYLAQESDGFTRFAQVTESVRDCRGPTDAESESLRKRIAALVDNVSTRSSAADQSAAQQQLCSACDEYTNLLTRSQCQVLLGCLQ